VIRVEGLAGPKRIVMSSFARYKQTDLVAPAARAGKAILAGRAMGSDGHLGRIRVVRIRHHHTYGLNEEAPRFPC
jgi:hypothetical protein